VIAGETLNLEATIREDGHLDLKAVDEVVHPDRTITVKFGQFESKDGAFTMLGVAHPFENKMLKYRCAINPVGAQGFVNTSACPVFPGVTGWETWPDPIVQLLMLDVRLVDADKESERVCE
jgi:hypothetical protein